MSEHTPESDKQQPKTQQARGARLASELLGRQVPEPDGPSELFDATPYDIEAKGLADGAETVAGIDAQNEAKVQARNAARKAEEAAELEGKTPHERNLVRSKRMLAAVQKADDEANAIQSPAREDETGKLVSTEASVEGAAQIEAAQKAVEAAAALAPAAAAAEQKAVGIDAAHKGAEPAHRVLQAIADRNRAIEEDRNMSALDDAYERVAAAEAQALKTLKAVEARIDATQGNPPASLRAAKNNIWDEHHRLGLKRKALKELIERPHRRVVEAQDDQPEELR